MSAAELHLPDGQVIALEMSAARKAKALVAKGTPKAQLYDKIIATGATTPQYIEVEGEADEKPKRERPDPNKVYKIPVPAKAPPTARRVASSTTTTMMIPT